MRGKSLLGVVLGVLLGWCGPVPSAGDGLSIRYLGLQGERANLSINRRTILLEPGQSSSEGVMVLSATRQQVVLRIGPRIYLFKRGDRAGVALSREVNLARDPFGMFTTSVEINGKPIPVVVDTGATYVSISKEQARNLRLRYRKNRPIKLQTASKVETAYLTTLQSVRLGGIVRLDVPAVITKGRHPDIVLLGMSFLHGLDIRQSEGTLTLRE